MRNYPQTRSPGRLPITLLFVLVASAALGAPGAHAAERGGCETVTATLTPPNWSGHEDVVGACATVDPWSRPHPRAMVLVGTYGEEGFCILEGDQPCPEWSGILGVDTANPGDPWFALLVCEGPDRACYSLP